MIKLFLISQFWVEAGFSEIFGLICILQACFSKIEQQKTAILDHLSIVKAARNKTKYRPLAMIANAVHVIKTFFQLLF